jgi:hypothetical protein
MWAFVMKWFWCWGPFSQVERCMGLPFSTMNSCSFFKCVVSIHFTTYVSLHSPTLQDHFQPFFTHSTPLFAIWRRGGTSQNITSKDVGKTSSWASSKTSALPLHLVDLKFDITIDANKSWNFNDKTMQIKLQNLSNPRYCKNKLREKNAPSFFHI